jgi:hypothetical protein
MIRKTLLTLVATTGLLTAGAATASAHECFIANRSAQGNAGASNSANWATLEMADLFAEAHNFFGGEPLTEAQLETALQMTEEQGIPLSLTTFTRFTIPRSLDEFDELSAASGDGKGVDHFFATHGEQLYVIFTTAQQS